MQESAEKKEKKKKRKKCTEKNF